MYTSNQLRFDNPEDSYVFWGISSVVIYNLWHLIWNLWNFKSQFRDWKYLGKLVLFFMASFGLVFMINQSPYQEYHFDNGRGPLFGLFVLFVVQFALKSQENIARLHLEKEQILTENFKTQLKVLHAKIDPHFLFNSMNTLRSMVRQSHANSEQFILSLSDFYRQTLKYNQEVQLKLSEELHLLQSYLFLMKHRNDKAVFVEIDIDEDLHNQSLPTLALQVVVENCFKHNSMTASKPLRIGIGHTTDGYIEITNNLQPKIQSVESTGNGLELLVKRYELMHISEGVIVEQTEDEFSVKLKLIA
jgi:hypothetical protein